MNSYARLTKDQEREIREQKLLQVEAEHFQLSMEVELAGAAGIENAQVDEARTRLAMLEIQVHLLRERIGINPVVPKVVNGTAKTVRRRSAPKSKSD